MLNLFLKWRSKQMGWSSATVTPDSASIHVDQAGTRRERDSIFSQVFQCVAEVVAEAEAEEVAGADCSLFFLGHY